MIRRKLWKPALGLVAMVSPLAIIASCSNQEQNTTDQPGADGVDKPQFNLDLNTRIERQKQIVDFNNRFDKILKTDVKRNVQTQVYETTTTQQYGNSFKYPSYDFNYEAKTNGKLNRYQTINNKEVDATTTLMDERVSWKDASGKDVSSTYADPNFIVNEIKNGNLKKHPAADGLFEQKISDQLGSVVKAFSIGGNIQGPSALGLYVAPGEVATIKFSKKTLELMQKQNINDLKIMINGSFWDNYKPDDAGQISNRYPYMMSEFRINVKDLIENNGEFKFGSPFGGTIDLVVNTKLKNPNSNPFYPSYANFDFQISGALETLLYVHGKTTKVDWDAQIEKIKNEEIQAPSMAIDFAYGSIQFQSTGPKQFVGVDYDKMIYPEPIMSRWTDFLFLSNLFASRDVSDSVTKIHFRFNNDIKSGGAAWGGGNQFKAPLSEAATGFLKGDQGWTISGQWLIFHEINHNFQQNGVLFQRRSHAETNQVSMFNLSVISDDGRYRNPYNWTGNYSSKTGPGWNRVQSGYASNRWMQYHNYTNNSKDGSEYEMQNHLLQLVGTYKFLEYVQLDAATAQNGSKDWTGFQEMVDLSNFYQLNFWPAFQKFSSWWYDKWPTTYEGATDQQKQQIDQLNKKYKAFDFVANVYATGNYLWDEKANDYLYTSDMQVPIDVSATGKYYFDFEKGINSANKDFKWDQLQYQATTKLGGTLTPDPDNGKILIYTPPKGHEGEIDEFDMAIRPDYKDLKDGANYVDQYGFKIKMFLNPRGPVVSLYKDVLSTNNNTFSEDEFAYMTDEKNISFSTISDPSRGIIHDQLRYSTGNWPKDEWQRMKISFDFVAPKAGSYQIQYQGDARLFVTKDYNNNEIWFDGSNQVASKNPYTIDQTLYLSQYESVHFDFYINANPDKTRFKVNAIHLPTGQVYNAYQNSTVGNLAIANEAALYEEQYQYHHRKVDLNKFQTKLFGNRVPNTSWSVDKSNPDQAYTISFNSASTSVNQNLQKEVDQKLGTQDNNVWELWGPKDGSKLEVTFDIDFVKPQTIGAVIIGHRTNNHYEARPTKIKVVDQNQNVLYDGSYGTQFNDRSQAQAITNLNKLATNVTKLTITLINEKVWGNGPQSALSIDHIGFTNQQNVGLNKILPMLDPTISYYGNDWNRIKNDPDVILSDVNFEAIGTATAGHYLQFSLYANSFDLIGQKLPDGTEFDLYINDQLVGTYNTTNPIRVDNAILATYQNAKPQWMNVRIVNKSDKPFRLNYIQTYGKHVEWKPWRS